MLSSGLGVEDQAAVVESLLYMLLSHELAFYLADHARLRIRSLDELGQESLIHLVHFVLTVPRLRLQLEEALLRTRVRQRLIGVSEVGSTAGVVVDAVCHAIVGLMVAICEGPYAGSLAARVNGHSRV